MKIKTGRGKYKPAKKQGLTWKNRRLLFQSPSWKSEKCRKIKSRFLIFARLKRGDYHAIEKAKSKRTEEMELYFFITSKNNLYSSSYA